MTPYSWGALVASVTVIVVSGVVTATQRVTDEQRAVDRLERAVATLANASDSTTVAQIVDEVAAAAEAAVEAFKVAEHERADAERHRVGFPELQGPSRHARQAVVGAVGRAAQALFTVAEPVADVVDKEYLCGDGNVTAEALNRAISDAGWMAAAVDGERIQEALERLLGFVRNYRYVVKLVEREEEEAVWRNEVVRMARELRARIGGATVNELREILERVARASRGLHMTEDVRQELRQVVDAVSKVPLGALVRGETMATDRALARAWPRTSTTVRWPCVDLPASVLERIRKRAQQPER